jgi:PAS domain S-box-containing protein
MLLNARRIETRPGQAMIFLSIEDITERKKQLTTLERQAALLEMTHETVIVRDLKGIAYFWNRGAEEMYGWSKEEVLGKSVPELLQTKFSVPFEQVKEELLRTGHWEGELVHVRRDGEKRIVNSLWALQKGEEGNSILL